MVSAMVSVVCVVVAVAVEMVVVCLCAVWRVWCRTLKNPVCRFKTSPCVPAPRADQRELATCCSRLAPELQNGQGPVLTLLNPWCR